ncbi:MAG: hypothetical protein LBG87_08100 [Spirochaetaceae bacterium]|jgi:hypothetical protein|nr:hypothetical protein [Spirochaetaceae bacterium]
MHIKGAGKPEGCKRIGFEAEFAEGLIASISIWGDFFASPEEAFDLAESQLTGLAPEALAGAFDRAMAAAGVALFGISGNALASVVFSALENRTEGGTRGELSV